MRCPKCSACPSCPLSAFADTANSANTCVCSVSRVSHAANPCFASFASIHALRCRSIHARTALSSVELLAERPVAPAAANLSWPFRQRQPALRRPVVSDYTTAWLDSFGSECGRGSSLTEFKRFCRSAFCGLRPSVGFVPSAEGPNVTVQSRGRGSCTLMHVSEFAQL